MDQLRKAFNSMVKSERYSRFPLRTAEEGERSVEMETEEQAGGSPNFRPATQRPRRTTVCYLALGVLVFFAIGYGLGYLSTKETRVAPVNCVQQQATGASDDEEEDAAAPPAFVPPPQAQMNWADVSQFLKQKLTSQAFEKTLRDLDSPNRAAGNREDNAQGELLFQEFKKLEMDPWTDIHDVQLPTPDSQRPNRVLFGSNVFKPSGYLAYSVTGSVQGKLVYGNYGRPQDLEALQRKNVEIEGCVMLLRAGEISFAEQVDNAATKGAAAVLIYPDSKVYKGDTELYGHVHQGSGDPYTPGFPSFNHTQFPPIKSSGLPKIPAQTITFNTATALLQGISGPESDPGFKGSISSVDYRLGGSENVTVEVNNVNVNKQIHNVYGVIKGFTDPDRYIVLGAQRDAWFKGYARATVGTSILLELARAVHNMVENDGFRPRRSLVFASWSAGEYGNVGATEWLEGYMASIDKRVFTYISLDGALMGRGGFMASASPLLYNLIERTMKAVDSPLGSGTVYNMAGGSKWEANTMRPMTMDDPAYPFLASSGIPSVSFHFINPNTESYPYYGTNLDTVDHLNFQTNHHTSEMAALAAQFAGHMALRLVHDHLLSLDVGRYDVVLTKSVVQLHKRILQLTQTNKLDGVSPTWLVRARSAFQRASSSISTDILNTDLNDQEACRNLNDRIMSVEHGLLSPYLSPIDSPYRHLLLGRGAHTLASIAQSEDMAALHTQLALATWTLKGTANAMVGNIWDLDQEI